MLAVARAFQMHCDGHTAQQVLDAITGRPDAYNDCSPAGDDDGFNRVPDSTSRCFRDVILPVVGRNCGGVVTFTARDEFAAFDGDEQYGRIVFPMGGPDELFWLLPPFDHTVSKAGRFYGQVTRVPLHPAICRNGMSFFFSSRAAADFSTAHFSVD